MKITELEGHFDPRGHLFEVPFPHEVVRVYVVATKPGQGRDLSVWHRHAELTESFVCVSGCAAVAVDDGDGQEVVLLSGREPQVVTVEPGDLHSVATVGEVPCVLLALCDRAYDPDDEGRRAMGDEFAWSAVLPEELR